jgi:hypothetical protein
VSRPEATQPSRGGRFSNIDTHVSPALQVENADELRELGHLSNGATPLWIRNTPSGLLPMLPRYLTHIDFDAEVAMVHPDPQWLRDHMSIRMVCSILIADCVSACSHLEVVMLFVLCNSQCE